MVAIVFENGRVEVREAAIPRRRKGYALIRVELAGICSTDLQLLQGYYGFSGVPGHEFSGIVMDADTEALVNRRVVADINLACGRCRMCGDGHGHHCPKRKVMGILGYPGAFQEYVALPERNLYLIPKSVSAEEAVFAEPLAAARRITDQVKMGAGERVAVLGDGKLGLLIVQVLKAQGLEVTLVGHNELKLALGRRWGARTALRPTGEYPWVVEVTGSPAGLAAAVAMTEPLGTLILKSTMHAGVAIDTAPMVVKELNIIGSRCGDMGKAVRLLRSVGIETTPLISATYPMHEAPKAIEHAREKGVLKVLLSN